MLGEVGGLTHVEQIAVERLGLLREKVFLR
jgi:hypothetical protein